MTARSSQTDSLATPNKNDSTIPTWAAVCAIPELTPRNPASAGRPVGTVDEDANPPLSDPAKSDVYGGTGQLPPQDTGSAIPPYEGRTRGATKEPSSTQGTGGANVGGATGPVSDPDYKSESPAATSGGATLVTRRRATGLADFRIRPR